MVSFAPGDMAVSMASVPTFSEIQHRDKDGVLKQTLVLDGRANPDGLCFHPRTRELYVVLAGGLPPFLTSGVIRYSRDGVFLGTFADIPDSPVDIHITRAGRIFVVRQKFGSSENLIELNDNGDIINTWVINELAYDGSCDGLGIEPRPPLALDVLESDPNVLYYITVDTAVPSCGAIVHRFDLAAGVNLPDFLVIPYIIFGSPDDITDFQMLSNSQALITNSIWASGTAPMEIGLFDEGIVAPVQSWHSNYSSFCGGEPVTYWSGVALTPNKQAFWAVSLTEYTLEKFDFTQETQVVAIEPSPSLPCIRPIRIAILSGTGGAGTFGTVIGAT